MARIITLAVALLAWGGALFACTRLFSAEVAWSHVLCGPWGCGPEAQAVAGMHLFWLVLLSGIAVAIDRIADSVTLLRLGMFLVAAGSATIVVIVGVDWTTWLSQSGTAPYRYLLQRSLFTVATAVDVPAVQCVLVGIGFVYRGRRQREN